MAYTDQDILTQIQFALIEVPDGGVTVSSGLWSTTELTDAINTAQDWLMRELWPVISMQVLVTVPNLGRYALPQDWMQTNRVAWQQPDGTTASLYRDSSWSSDALDHTWAYDLSPEPLAYTDQETPMPQLQVMPAASDAGLIHLWYTALPTRLSNTGVAWTLPDALVPVAKWKALSILLGKDGRGQDLPRSAAADQRATEGLTIALLMTQGWYGGLQ